MSTTNAKKTAPVAKKPSTLETLKAKRELKKLPAEKSKLKLEPRKKTPAAAGSAIGDKKLREKLAASGIEVLNFIDEGAPSYKLLVGGSTKADGDYLSLVDPDLAHLITWASLLQQHISMVADKRAKLLAEED